MVAMGRRISYRDHLLDLADQMIAVAQRMELACRDDSCRLLVAIVKDAAFTVRREVMVRGAALAALDKKPPKGGGNSERRE